MNLSLRSTRPLVMRCGAMGDMVLLLPLIRTLSESFRAPVDVVSSGGWTRPLLTGQKGLDSFGCEGPPSTRERPPAFDAKAQRSRSLDEFM